MATDDLITAMDLLSLDDAKKVNESSAISPALDPGLDIFRPAQIDIGIKDTRLIEYWQLCLKVVPYNFTSLPQTCIGYLSIRVG